MEEQKRVVCESSHSNTLPLNTPLIPQLPPSLLPSPSSLRGLQQAEGGAEGQEKDSADLTETRRHHERAADKAG